MKMNDYKTIDEYLAQFANPVRAKLEKMRSIIKNAAPDATETIRYGIPTFQINGKNTVHFGGYPTHIGFYPSPNGMKEFEDELAPYASGKGTAQFPIEGKLPEDLIAKIVRFRVSEIKRKKREE